MTKNSLFRAAFLYGELDASEKQSYIKRYIIRTDFILENVFSHLVQKYYQFDAISPMNEKEKHLFEKLKEIINAFRDHYTGPVKNLCAEIDVICENTVGSIILGVANELFSEGITWSKILAFFVFIGELTVMCIVKKLPKSIVDVLYECFSRLVKEKLESWIEDHNGWEGIKSLSVVTKQKHSLKTSWKKNLFHIACQVINLLPSPKFQKYLKF